MRTPPRPATACIVALSLTALLAPPPTRAAGDGDEGPFAHLEWRNVGPVNMSGRVSDVEGVPGDPNVVWVGAASGGVWKTVDGGLTFAPVFDDQPIASIGDLALEPGNPAVVWVGTGESNARNSVSFGDGVYKSTDGGASWRHLGLEGTRHVSRVLVSPRHPDTVFVGALGSLFGPNEERGVFRTGDGGESWERVLYLDDRHGVSDMDMDPTNPNVLFAALWHFDRKPWTHTSGSSEGGVWRSVDGGDTWSEVEGLPETMGRIGVKIAPSDPEIVYVIAESDEGTLFRSTDRGETFEKVTDEVSIVSRGLYYTDLRVDPTDPNRLYAVASRLQLSIDGGRTWERIAGNVHVDFHALWIDPLDPDRIWVGEDGGIAVSYDRGGSWEPIRNLPIGQFYQVFADDREPFYRVGGGLQDNGTWIGPSRTREPAGILPDDWRMFSFGDAYWVVPHPEDPDLFLSESQGGAIVRTDLATRQQVDVAPQPRRNDGGPVGELEYRFNWNAPIVASPHDPGTVYFGGNVVFRTRDFGDTWEVISPDLTTDDPEKQGVAGGPVWVENTTAEYHTTILSLAESPAEPGVIWAGTDDGNLQITRDDGATWTNVVADVPGVPAFSPVSHVEPSRVAAGRAYATFDRHMFDDFAAHVFVTEDFGASWRRIDDALPEGAWAWVVREDPTNPDLLWLGTELGLFASRDRGASWERAHLGNLPTVAVHDVLVHPRENDLILGTHGRSIWIFDDATPLQRFSDEVAASDLHLFPARRALRFPVRFTRYGRGDKAHTAPNPPYGALLTYWLKEELAAPGEGDGDESGGGGDAGESGEAAEGAAEDAAPAPEERISLEILDAAGALVKTLDAKKLPREAGLNRVAWNLAADAPPQRTDEEPEESIWREPPRGPYVLPGTYTARLTVDGASREATVEVGVDPLLDVTRADLEAQHTAASRLSELLGRVNTALRGLDLLSAQLEERRATAEKLDLEPSDEGEAALAAMEEALAEHLDGLARDEEVPFWSQGPRLVERIQDLFGAIDGAFAAPTAAQSAYLAELEAEAEERLGAYRELVAAEVPGLNLVLASEGLPTVVVPRGADG